VHARTARLFCKGRGNRPCDGPNGYASIGSSSSDVLVYLELGSSCKVNIGDLYDVS
jgi:hypothetical protein